MNVGKTQNRKQMAVPVITNRISSSSKLIEFVIIKRSRYGLAQSEFRDKNTFTGCHFNVVISLHF